MEKSCSVYNCQQRCEPGISFHKFPEGPLQKQWLIAMKREKWKPSPSSALCSRHFEESCYNISPSELHKDLKIDAVPSIFEFSEHLQKDTKPRPSPKKRISVEIDVDTESKTQCATTIVSVDCGLKAEANVNNFEEPVPKKLYRYIGDFNFSNPMQYKNEELIQFIKLAKSTIGEKNRNIKSLQQKVNRQEKQIESMTSSLLQHLQNKDLATESKTQCVTTIASVDCGLEAEANVNNFKEPVPKKPYRYFGDFDFSDPMQYKKEELIYFMKLAKSTIDQKNRNIKSLKQKMNRQEKQIESMTSSLLQYLQNKDLATTEAA